MKSCIQCHSFFEIHDRDQKYYEKMAPEINGKRYLIPEPTLCPKCRQQRRFAFRNERHLYRRKCDGSGKEIISMYSENSPYKVYAQDVWWQGNWDGTDFGRDYDFERPFFEQFRDLMRAVPRIALLNVNSENSEYCNFTGDVKNSYLIFGSVYSEDCYYGSPYYSKNCVDTLVLRECELCYECIDCRKLYNCLYCQDCNHSHDLWYCFDVQGCSDCIGCAGLRNQQYCIFNEKLSREDYLKKKSAINWCRREDREKLEAGLDAVKRKTPRLFMQAIGSENVSGSHVFNSKKTFEAFFADRCEDCSYCTQVVDLKDCYDNNYTEENELCYEYLGMYGTKRTSFSLFCRHTYETYYSDYCVNSSYLFGCSNLRNKKYCILNKQYSKEEYETLVPRIIEQMGGRLASAKHEPTNKEWGEFFPVKISPFAFNETVANEYFPLSREEVLERGWGWKEDDKRQFQAQTVQVPENIKDVSNSICYEILACEKTGRNYRIIPQELDFYRRMNLAIPRKHPDERHRERIAKRNPRCLFERTCDKCRAAILTSYSPNLDSEKVYCEKCYLEDRY